MDGAPLNLVCRLLPFLFELNINGVFKAEWQPVCFRMNMVSNFINLFKEHRLLGPSNVLPNPSFFFNGKLPAGCILFCPSFNALCRFSCVITEVADGRRAVKQAALLFA